MKASKANLPVVPFSNGLQADYWQETNCGKCARCPRSSAFSGHPEPENEEDITFEADSVTEVRAGACQLNVRLEMGYFEGSIPAKTAWRIGARHEHLSKSNGTVFVRLPARCAEFVPM